MVAIKTMSALVNCAVSGVRLIVHVCTTPPSTAMLRVLTERVNSECAVTSSHSRRQLGCCNCRRLAAGIECDRQRR